MVTKTILGLISTLTQIDAIASMHLQDIFEITFKTPSTGPIMWLDPTNLPLGTPKTLQNLGAESLPPF